MARRGFDPGYSFRSGDFRERATAVPVIAEGEGMRRCARGEWCSSRVVTFENGERIVTPGLTPRPYCHRCDEHIARCAADLPGFWLRLAAAIGDPLQAEVQVHIPFGPQVLLREDVDAHLRLTALILGGWAARVRAVPQLALSAPQHAYDSAEGVRDNARVLVLNASVLLALQPAWMVRAFSFHPARKGKPDLISEDIEAEHADTELVRVGVDFAALPVMTDGEDAGREIMFLHYRCRSLLLETNPRPELLISPCRQCSHRALYRAWPDSDRDLVSRCAQCGDEMTSDEFDVNAKRWLAYHRAHAERPVLADAPAA